MNGNGGKNLRSNQPHRRTDHRYRTALSQAGLSRILLIAGMGTVAAGFSFALTASTLLQHSNPELAVLMMPINALALSSRAEQLLKTEPVDGAHQAEETARAALRIQAINPTAFQVLGFVATAKGDEQSGRGLMAQAQIQSRRNAPIQYWLIEDAVRRGDVSAALDHYDILLRTKPSSKDMLFPILLNALNEPAVRSALGSYYHADEIWAPLFATYALANSRDLDALAALELESGGLKNPKFAHDQAVGLIGRLVSENRFSMARRVYLAMPDARPSKLVTAGFDAADVDARYGAIGWQTRMQADSSSTLTETAHDRPALLVSANSLTTANVATKLLYLTPGKYRVDAELSRFEGGDGAAVGMQIRCPELAGDPPLWSQKAKAKKIVGEFVLPANCAVQYLDIVAFGGSSGSMLDAAVRSVAVRPQ